MSAGGHRGSRACTTTSRAMAQGGGCCAGVQQQSHPRKDHGGQPGSSRRAAGSERRGPSKLQHTNACTLLRYLGFLKKTITHHTTASLS